MANEIKITNTITYNSTSGAGLKRTIQPGTININQSNIGYYSKMQVVTTASTTLEVMADVTTAAGVLYLRNLDSANFVTFGSSLLEFRINAGESWTLRATPSATIQIKADTASVNVETVLFEN